MTKETNTEFDVFGLRLTWAGDQWVVAEKPLKSKKADGGSWRAVSFHTKLHHALTWIVERRIGSAGLRSVEEALGYLEVLPGYIQRELEKAGVTRG